MASGVKLLHLVPDNISSKSSTDLYCPRFERRGDESVPVSRSFFRTRKTNLLLTPVAWIVCWIYEELFHPECFSK